VLDFDFFQGSFIHVIHAGPTSSAPVPPSEMLDAIIRGIKRTIEFARCSGVPDLQTPFLAKIRNRNGPFVDRPIFLLFGSVLFYWDPWRINRGDSNSGTKTPAGRRKRAH